MRNNIFYAIAISLILVSCQQEKKDSIFLEAESFKDKGGWVIDQQFMDVMGSPFLMAHGMGEPVEDAQTTIEVDAPGQYYLFVRTWNWVSPWNVPGAPGQFQVLFNNEPCKMIFGKEGNQWHWQNGGPVQLQKGKNIITLKDLTGFNGRCDAIYLTTTPNDIPPENIDTLAAFRKQKLGMPESPESAGEFDLVVVGGGIAGTCAALSAAREGLKVALIQDRPVLGGNNSSEVRVHLGGKINLPPYPGLGNIVKEIGPERQGNAQPADYYEDEKKLKAVKQEENISLFLNYHANKVNKRNGLISSVIAQNIETSKELVFEAPLFVDCTGDGTIGYLAGADWRMGRESKKETGEERAPEKADDMTMGASVQWYSVETDEDTLFSECPWAVPFDEETAQKVFMGEWDWETGMYKHQIEDFEYVRDYALRVIYGNWAFLKNKYTEKEKYTNRKLDWVAYVAGKRESRRLLGDVILKQQDIMEKKSFPDACVTTTWTIDLHYPDSTNLKHFPDGPFRSIAIYTRIDPYPIPYRCLYSRNVDNLFMAGRNISVTHVALGTIRVMRTTGMMGEVIGKAATICNKNDVLPRDVYASYLDELKEQLISLQ